MKDQLYLIKRGDNQFVEETDVVLKASGGNIGVGSHVPSSKFDVDGKATFKAVNVNDILNVDSDGKVGDIAPQEDDIIVWDGTKWKAGVNAGGIIGGSAVVTSLNAGSSNYTVNFPDTYSAVPAIATDLSIQGEGPIIPYTIANITTSGYDVIFAQPLPNNNYSIHTVFGGNVVLDTGEISGSASDWEAAGLSKIYYVGSVGIGTTNPSDGLLHLRQSSNDAIRLERSGSGANDGNIYLGHSGGGFGISTTGAIGVTVPDLFIDPQGNVGIGTANPGSNLEISSPGPAIRLTDETHNTTAVFSSNNEGDVILNADLNSVRNNSAIRLRVDGTERMHIDSNGNVGIGTTNPGTYRLKIEGGDLGVEKVVSIVSSGDNMVLVNTATEEPYLKFDGKNSTTGLNWTIGLDDDNLTDEKNLLAFKRWDDASALKDTPLVIDSDGNVGIGTTDPSTKLEVAAPVMSIFRNTNTVGLSNGLHFKFGDSASADIPQSYASIGAVIENSATGSHDGALAFTTAKSGVHTVAEERMRIDSSGNVGIGTTDPGAKLELVDAVDGDVSIFIHNNDTTSGSSAQTSSIDFKFARTGSSAIRRTGAKIVAGKEGEWDSTSASQDGYLELYTTNAGTSNPVVHIDSAGNVGIGTASPTNALNVIKSSTSGVPVAWIHNSNNSTTGNFGTVVSCVNNNPDVNVFQVRSNNVTHTNGNALFTVKGDGNVGIGTTGPSAKLHIENGDLRIEKDTKATIGFKAHSSGSASTALAFRDSNAGIDRMTISSGGKVGIGTNDPKVIHHISTEIDSTNYAVTRFSADNQQFDVGVGGSTAAITGIRNKFYIFDSKLSQTRLVMDSAGNVSIGTSDTGGQLYVKSAASSQTCRLYRSTNTSTARVFDILSNSGGTNTVQFLVNADGVTQNKTGTISQISSDERLKENISDANPKLQDLLKLKVKNFNFSDDENKTKYIGFVAQEMEEVFPSLVMTKDTREYDEDGNLLSGLEDSKSTKVSMDFAILTKAIQEQQSIIEDLKSQNESLIQRIENLENK